MLCIALRRCSASPWRCLRLAWFCLHVQTDRLALRRGAPGSCAAGDRGAKWGGQAAELVCTGRKRLAACGEWSLLLFARVPALAPSSLSGVHAWPVVVPDALALAQVLRLAEAHIKHEKEELKSLGVVLDRNKQDSDQRFMALEARLRATDKDKQEFDLRIYREREQIRALEAALNDIRVRSGRTQEMVQKAYSDEQVFLDHVRKLKASFAADRSRLEQEVGRVRAQLMQVASARAVSHALSLPAVAVALLQAPWHQFAWMYLRRVTIGDVASRTGAAAARGGRAPRVGDSSPLPCIPGLVTVSCGLRSLRAARNLSYRTVGTPVLEDPCERRRQLTETAHVRNVDAGSSGACHFHVCGRALMRVSLPRGLRRCLVFAWRVRAVADDADDDGVHASIGQSLHDAASGPGSRSLNTSVAQGAVGAAGAGMCLGGWRRRLCQSSSDTPCLAKLYFKCSDVKVKPAQECGADDGLCPV